MTISGISGIDKHTHRIAVGKIGRYLKDRRSIAHFGAIVYHRIFLTVGSDIGSGIYGAGKCDAQCRSDEVLKIAKIAGV